MEIYNWFDIIGDIKVPCTATGYGQYIIENSWWGEVDGTEGDMDVAVVGNGDILSWLTSLFAIGSVSECTSVLDSSAPC